VNAATATLAQTGLASAIYRSAGNISLGIVGAGVVALGLLMATRGRRRQRPAEPIIRVL
jgi:hypothetical protein